mgnify:CR=1 FL=1
MLHIKYSSILSDNRLLYEVGQLFTALFGCCFYQDVVKHIINDWKRLSIAQKIGYIFGTIFLIICLDF